MAFLAPIAPELSLAAGGVQAIGNIQSSQAQASAAGYNAKIAGMNAQLATQQAGYEGAVGEQKVGEAGLKAEAEAGKVKVNQAANNIDVNSGSAVGVQKSQSEMAMLNEMNIRSNAARSAYGYETQAAGDVAQANLDRAQQSSDKTAGYVGAAGSLLAGASQASMYSKYLSGTGLSDIVSNGLDSHGYAPGESD
jgi:hypothetical protein